ncbi:MAG TPA: hypothetical protein VFR41_13750 [Acidimicrobiia bacterium]|nr:hypothetical protein [Acidimicrobiia bacterium]
MTTPTMTPTIADELAAIDVCVTCFAAEIDAAIERVRGRERFTSAEVVDVLLDLRLIVVGGPTVPS